MWWQRIVMMAVGGLVLVGCGRPVEQGAAAPPDAARREPRALSPWTAWHRPMPAPRGQASAPLPMPIARALDANRDGTISSDEIAKAPDALRALDKNGDGQVTRAELMPRSPRGPSPDWRRDPGMRRHPRW